MFGIQISIDGQGRSYQLPPCPITQPVQEADMSKKTYYATVLDMPRAEMPTDPRFVDRTGQVFGRLTVLHHGGKRGHVRLWACRCSCKDGSLVVVADSSLMRGATTSCGCFRLERVQECSSSHGLARKGAHHYLYDTYRGILERCTDTNNLSYPRYGGRGIASKFAGVADFAEYIMENLGERPPGFSLDRFNNDGNYEPGNLRWASAAVQTRNTSRNRYIETANGAMLLADAAEQAGLDYKIVHTRITYRGWSVDRALTTPHKRILQQQPEPTHETHPA